MFKELKFNKVLGLILLLGLSLGLISCKTPEEEIPVPKEINTSYTDELKLTSVYDDKDFLSQGIGLVTLTQNVDGDTAHFKGKSGYTFTVRFLGINTPESTGRIDAWGKAASKFVAEKLKKANEEGEIVLESEVIDKPAVVDSTRKRYLAYVWYRNSTTEDFRLLNLEIVEQCYSTFTGTQTELKYGDEFQNAHLKSYGTKRRVYGETDPSYDYSGEVVEVTIAEIKQNFTNYTNGSKFKITARVMRLSGDNLYLEDLDQTFNEQTNEYDTAGIYMFSGYGSGLAQLNIGTVIEFECQVSSSDTYGNQLTNPRKVTILENAEGSVVDVRVIVPTNTKEYLEKFEGFVVKIKNFEVTKKGDLGDTGEFTIYGKLPNGTQLNVRVSKEVNPKFKYSEINVGDIYDVIGGISKFHDNYQVMLGNKKGHGINDLLKK